MQDGFTYLKCKHINIIHSFLKTAVTPILTTYGAYPKELSLLSVGVWNELIH